MKKPAISPGNFVPAVLLCLIAQGFGLALPPSTLDPDFGVGGRVLSSPDGTELMSGGKIALQSDGKIVMVGNKRQADNGAYIGMVVARYNANGTLDTTFDSDGWTTVTFNATYERAADVGIQSDGKILLAGNILNYNPDNSPISEFGIARLNSDGSIDTTFDGDGKMKVDPILTPYQEYISLLRIRSDGKMIVAGTAALGGVHDRFVLARVNPDGSLDSNFGSGGILVDVIMGGSNLDRMTDLVFLPDGKFVASCAILNIVGTFRRAIKYTETGGREWEYNPDANNTSNGLHGIAALPSGKFIVVGRRLGKIHVGRLNANGTSDVTFADVVGVPNGDARSVGIQTDGKIVANIYPDASDSSFSVIRYQSTGLLDSSFGTGGIATTTLTGGDDIGERLIIQPDGKILVGGYTELSGPNRYYFSMVRYIGDAVAPPPALFDYDADGRADVSVFRPSENKWYIFRSSDSTIMQPVFAIAGDVPVPADYDGDAKTDVAIYRPSNGAWWYLSSLNGAQINVNWGGEAGDIPRPSDFDGDGKTDFVFFRPSNNFWYRINSAGTISNVQFGLAGDKPVRGDFDGDAKGDVAIYRPSTGDWWYQSSINGAQLAVRWGIATDIPAPADFDGDRKTDFAVYRPSTGVWYIINSSNGSFTIGSFGISEDKPVPADFDGDGKADIAVFRPSTGIWYLLRSTAGFGATQWGISTDIPTENAFVSQ